MCHGWGWEGRGGKERAGRERGCLHASAQRFLFKIPLLSSAPIFYIQNEGSRPPQPSPPTTTLSPFNLLSLKDDIYTQFALPVSPFKAKINAVHWCNRAAVVRDRNTRWNTGGKARTVPVFRVYTSLLSNLSDFLYIYVCIYIFFSFLYGICVHARVVPNHRWIKHSLSF